MAQVSAQQEAINDHEIHLEDIYEGIISVGKMLKPIKGYVGPYGQVTRTVLSAAEMINVAFYVAGRVAHDLEELEKVKRYLPDDARRQLMAYQRRFSKQNKEVVFLKMSGGDSMTQARKWSSTSVASRNKAKKKPRR